MKNAIPPYEQNTSQVGGAIKSYPFLLWLCQIAQDSSKKPGEFKHQKAKRECFMEIPVTLGVPSQETREVPCFLGKPTIEVGRHLKMHRDCFSSVNAGL